MELIGRRFDEKYELMERLGHGNFGEVYRIRELSTGTMYALKRIRTGVDASKVETLPPAAFNEIQALQQLVHPNIMHLVEIIPEGACVGLVMEYLEMDLSHLIQYSHHPISTQDIKSLMYMLLRGIEHCHKKNIMHRDLKPSNLLVDSHGILKICDFGLATVYTGPNREYSHQVATRWYRAPELLFGSRSYNGKVDMWSIGAIFAELLQQAPLFPGLNDIDQIFRVIQILGSPTWEGIKLLPDYNKVTFPEFQPLSFEILFPDVDEIALDLLSRLLLVDPSLRIGATEALKHAYFWTYPLPQQFVKIQVESQRPSDTVSSAAKSPPPGVIFDAPFF